MQWCRKLKNFVGGGEVGIGGDKQPNIGGGAVAPLAPTVPASLIFKHCSRIFLKNVYSRKILKRCHQRHLGRKVFYNKLEFVLSHSFVLGIRILIRWIIWRSCHRSCMWIGLWIIIWISRISDVSFFPFLFGNWTLHFPFINFKFRIQWEFVIDDLDSFTKNLNLCKWILNQKEIKYYKKRLTSKIEINKNMQDQTRLALRHLVFGY